MGETEGLPEGATDSVAWAVGDKEGLTLGTLDTVTPAVGLKEGALETVT